MGIDAERDTEQRTGWLLQIPSRALRALILKYVPVHRLVHWLSELEMRFRTPQTALNRLTTEQLIRLINAYPQDVPDPIVEAAFREYRHGRSPSLHLYVVPPAGLVGFDLEQADRRARRAVRRASRLLEQEDGREAVLPRLRGLTLEPLAPLADWPDGLHAGYHCQSRLDYIATDGRVTSTYRLFYGHLWVDLGRAFVAIHVHPAALEPVLVDILSQALQVPLSLVRVDKQLKPELKFLQKASCRRARLVDPNPNRRRFRSITLADDQDLAQRQYLERSYQQWENDFPEMASARYYANFVGKRELSLSIGVRRGSLTLSGAVSASDLRVWARDTGSQVVSTWRARRQQHLKMPPAALDHERMWSHPLLGDFPDDLRRLVLTLVQALATIKERQDPQFNIWPLPLATDDLAQTVAQANAQELLGKASNAGGPVPWFQVMMRADCPEENCPAVTEYLVCPSCRRTLFTLTTSDLDERVLACANPYCRGRWFGSFPLQTECEEEHPFQLDWDARMGQRLELFVGEKLALLMQKLLASEAKVYHFNASKESLWVRNDTLVHQPARPAYVVRQAGDVQYHTGGGAVILGHVDTGGGDFVGRDRMANDLFVLVQACVQDLRLSPQERRRLKAALDTVWNQVLRGEAADLARLEKALVLLAEQDPRVAGAMLIAVRHPATRATPAVKALIEKVLAPPQE